jgi:hypothetical protein
MWDDWRRQEACKEFAVLKEVVCRTGKISLAFMVDGVGFSRPLLR